MPCRTARPDRTLLGFVRRICESRFANGFLKDVVPNTRAVTSELQHLSLTFVVAQKVSVLTTVRSVREKDQ